MVYDKFSGIEKETLPLSRQKTFNDEESVAQDNIVTSVGGKTPKEHQIGRWFSQKWRNDSMYVHLVCLQNDEVNVGAFLKMNQLWESQIELSLYCFALHRIFQYFKRIPVWRADHKYTCYRTSDEENVDIILCFEVVSQLIMWHFFCCQLTSTTFLCQAMYVNVKSKNIPSKVRFDLWHFVTSLWLELKFAGHLDTLRVNFTLC